MDKYFSKHLTQSFGKVKIKLGDMITHTLTNNNPSTTTNVIQVMNVYYPAGQAYSCDRY